MIYLLITKNIVRYELLSESTSHLDLILIKCE